MSELAPLRGWMVTFTPILPSTATSIRRFVCRSGGPRGSGFALLLGASFCGLSTTPPDLVAVKHCVLLRLHNNKASHSFAVHQEHDRLFAELAHRGFQLRGAGNGLAVDLLDHVAGLHTGV